MSSVIDSVRDKERSFWWKKMTHTHRLSLGAHGQMCADVCIHLPVRKLFTSDARKSRFTHSDCTNTATGGLYSTIQDTKVHKFC